MALKLRVIKTKTTDMLLWITGNVSAWEKFSHEGITPMGLTKLHMAEQHCN